MSLWDTINSWISNDAQKYIYTTIRTDHVKGGQDEPVMAAGASYFRVWLNEMFLEKDRTWGTTWYPAVHSSLRLQFGSEQIELPYIAGSLNLPGLDLKDLSKVVQLNHQLSPLIPFNGGIVELVAGLLALQGDNAMNRYLKTISDFASLLKVPQLSAGLAVAVPIANGIQDLLNSSHGGLQLGFHQTFTGQGGLGGARLKPGYHVVILAQAEPGIENRLWLINNQLYYGDSEAEATPFTGYTYMLFHIEGRAERDDWEALKSISEPRAEAIRALANDDTNAAQDAVKRSIAAARLSPDLTTLDRKRIIKVIKEEFDELSTAPAGAIGAAAPDLNELMLRAPSVEQAQELPEPTISELF